MRSFGKSVVRIGSIAAMCIAFSGIGLAQDVCDAKCLAEKTQDPLANVRAVMTDNTVVYNTAGGTAYGFLFQPVASIPTEKGFNMIARGIIPLVGAPTGAELPPLGGIVPGIPGRETVWGLSDIRLQLFFAPHTEGKIKYGFGPQMSLRTRTSTTVAGSGWGAGPAFVLFGSVGQLSYGVVANQLWGQDGYSVTAVQPILIYNLPFIPGTYVGYNNSINYDWTLSGGDRWQAPVGLMGGYTFALDGGYALDLSVGAYSLPVRPAGGGNWQLKFAMSFFLP